jgi:hypothetical protein
MVKTQRAKPAFVWKLVSSNKKEVVY